MIRRSTALWALLIVAALIIVGGIVWIAVRDQINTGRCQQVLGPGASWNGKSLCNPPPVHVDGLL